MATKRTSGSAEKTHSIQVVSRRTGLSQDVLRVWEKRYEAVTPRRTATGRRVYTAEDLERLTLLRRVTQAGRRISDVAGLSTEALQALSAEDLAAEQQRSVTDASTGAAASYLERSLAKVSALDGPGLEAVLSQALSVLPGLEFVDDLLCPLFREIGRRWEAGTLDPYEEHLATGVVRGLLGRMFAGRASEDSPVFVAATPSGHQHELGALLAAVTAMFAGYRVVYLGPDLPATSIAKAARAAGASVVALSLVHPKDRALLVRELKALRSELPPDTQLVLGGATAGEFTEPAGGANVHALQSFRELDASLRHWSGNPL